LLGHIFAQNIFEFERRRTDVVPIVVLSDFERSLLQESWVKFLLMTKIKDGILIKTKTCTFNSCGCDYLDKENERRES